ncbi:MAG: protein kinase [Planctomycetota bacterium]
MPIDWISVEQAGVLPPKDVAALKLLAALRRGHAGAAMGLPPEPDGGQGQLEIGFELLREIGRGSTGRVWRARDKALNREVALKVLHDDLRVSTPARRRFLQEARLLASVDHPNVVRIHSISEEGQHLRLSLELVLGATLDKVAREQGPFAPEEAARIGADLCRALAALHAKGLVHRDLKPSNVIREHGGRVVLLDFSLVRAERGGSVEGTSSQEGTPLFMAPEQFEGREPIGTPADIYGLGALLYWLVALRHPCAGETFGEVRARAVEGKVTPLLEVRPELPRPFVAIVERALHRDPVERFGSAGEMEGELRAFLARGEHRRRVRTAWIVVGVLLLLGAAAFWGVQRWLPMRLDSAVILEPSAPRAGDAFGYTLASDGKRILVGCATTAASSVHVFAPAGERWAEEQELLASDASPADAFGCSLAIRDDLALVGAYQADTHGLDSGAVYLFQRDPQSGTWRRLPDLVGAEEGAGDHFGFALEWTADFLFVGAIGQETPLGENRGRVHIFRRSGATFRREASLFAPDGVEGDIFGSSIDFDDGRLAVGAYAAETRNGQNSGAVYVYRQRGSDWILEQTMLGSAADQQAGVSISLCGGFLAIGESENPTRGHAAGQVDLWTRDAATNIWSGPVALHAPDTDAWDGFGKCVLFVGKQLLVGAPYDEGAGRQGGTVSCFRRTGETWKRIDQFVAPSPLADGFGVSVVHAGSFLVVGAYGTDVGGHADAGAAYVLTPPAWLESPGAR